MLCSHVEVVIDGHSGDGDIAVPAAFIEDEGGEAGGLDSRDGGDALLNLLVERGHAWIVGGEASGGRVDLEAQNAFLVEAGIDVVEVDETSQEEHGADQKDERERDLRDDEGFGEWISRSSGGGSATVAE